MTALTFDRMDTDVARMFGDLREDIGALAATMKRVETQTTATNGTLRRHDKRLNELEGRNDNADGAAQQRQKTAGRWATGLIIVGAFTGGILAVLAGLLLAGHPG